MKTKEIKISPYKILTNWLYDGSKLTQFPQELIDDKSIGQNFLLYFFQQSSYGLIISKIFNNFGLYILDRIEVFKFIKEAVSISGYKQQYIERGIKHSEKFEKLLKLKFPYLKNYELPLLVDIIDKSEEKESIYQMFGIYDIKKKKSTKSDLKKLEDFNDNEKKKISENNILSNFTL
jgi:hypothetical protein